jgi:AcrR family transcriptional regulator
VDSKTLAPTARQEEILDRAIELMRESGLAGLTMKKVAERVGFTEPAVYRHFPTKQALLLGIVGRLGQMLLGPIREIAARSDLPAAERLERIVSHHLGLIIETNGLPVLLLMEASVSEDEALVQAMTHVARTYLGIAGSVLGELGLPADAPPPGRMALPFLGLGAAVALQRRLMPDMALPKEEAQSLVRFLVGCVEATCGEGGGL